jgi:Nitrous oxide-stimulated promoter
MPDTHPRIERERRTMEAMIRLYCRGVHRNGPGACAECGELLSYALKRLEKCPFQEKKAPCARCPVHCYQKARREQMKAVMRYSGPRIFLSHPLFTLKHWLDGFRKVPSLPRPSAGPPPNLQGGAPPTGQPSGAAGE